ncbi:MAG TPA: methyltransferase domain-containing protein [Chloroflexota bacterium]|nr:methyltransferase domain-containing protein [Chloroflexota bacterium]
MTLFPLDRVQNARIDHRIEPMLEEVRTQAAKFDWPEDDDLTVEDLLGVYDLARPRMNVLVTALQDMIGSTGADIGAGVGFLAIALRRIGITTILTEQDTSLCRLAAAEGLEVRPYRIGRDRVPFEPESLDFIVLAEVLEHLKLAPVHVLQALTSVLRHGGRLLVTTPNVARLDHIESLAAGENFLEPFPEALPPGADATDYVEHVREYSVREVVEAIEATGLTVDWVRMTGWGDTGYHPLPNPFVNEIVVVQGTK